MNKGIFLLIEAQFEIFDSNKVPLIFYTPAIMIQWLKKNSNSIIRIIKVEEYDSRKNKTTH